MKLKMPRIPGSRVYVVYQVNVAPGDRVTADQELFTAETSKGVVAVKAPVDGVVTHVFVREGDQASPRTVFALLTELDENGNPVEDDLPE